MGKIIYKERKTGKLEEEKVYGKFFLECLYGTGFISKLFSLFALPLFARFTLFSKIYGMLQKSVQSREKIAPFIKNFQIDTSEFLKHPSQFRSFNDFFTRKLKPEARPFAGGDHIAVLPTDGRYLVFPDISKVDGFYVKGKKFDLHLLIRDEFLFDLYKKGSMVIARLCPTDYHRFHFPFACTPGKSKLINGPLYSVNPLALRARMKTLSENKRVLTELQTEAFGKVLWVEVGATCVGSIKQTYTPGQRYQKGDEKGYFEFGGSCLIFFFQEKKIEFATDLIISSKEHIEMKGKLGEPLGRVFPGGSKC